MALEKRESREGVEGSMGVLGIADTLEKIYGMNEVRLSPGELKAFRDKTQPVSTKWTEEIGVDLVRNTERVIESAR